MGLVYTWVDFADREAKPTGRLHKPTAEGNVLEEMLRSNLMTSGSVPVIRRRCFEAVGLFDPDLAITQDLDMWLRIAAHFPFAAIQEPLVYYRQHPNSISTNCQQQEKDFLKMMDKVFSAHPEYASMQSELYGMHYRYLAWRSVESRDYKAAARYVKSAIRYYPKVVLSDNFRRLITLLLIGNYRRFRAGARHHLAREKPP